MKKDKGSVPLQIPGLAYYIHDFCSKRYFTDNDSINLWEYIGFWRDVMELEGTVDGVPFRFAVNKINNDEYSVSSEQGFHTAQVRFCYDGYMELILDGKYSEYFISTSENGTGYVTYKGQVYEVTRQDVLYGSQALLGSMDSKGHGDGKIVSPMPGKVIKINVKEGAEVKKGTTLLIVEAMKMENYITAPVDGFIEKVNVKVGDMVDSSKKLVDMK
jgi:biotin carboxyl carrier protein